MFRALLGATDGDDVRAQLRKGLAENISLPLAARIGGTDAERRAHVFAAVVVGLLSTIWVIGDDAICSLPPDAMAE